jgi:hypothetical protein
MAERAEFLTSRKILRSVERVGVSEVMKHLQVRVIGQPHLRKRDWLFGIRTERRMLRMMKVGQQHWGKPVDHLRHIVPSARFRN